MLLGNAGESDAQIGLGSGNGTHSVFVQQMNAQFFGFHCLQFQAHEVAGVERIVGPCSIIFAAVED